MKTKIKTLEQFTAQLADKVYECQLEYDQAFDNLLYAREAIKTNKPSAFDWPGYLKNAELQYKQISGQLELVKLHSRNAEKAYVYYVKLQTQLNSLRK